MSSLYIIIIYQENGPRKVFQIHLLSVAKPRHAVRDQMIAIYALQHFNIHVAKHVRIAERKTVLSRKIH